MNEKILLKNGKEYPLVIGGTSSTPGTLRLIFQTDEALEDIVGRGSREPCGLKSRHPHLSCPLTGRGSREPCGLKYYLLHLCHWLNRRGSREPCGLKFDLIGASEGGREVEARESLVD